MNHWLRRLNRVWPSLSVEDRRTLYLLAVWNLAPRYWRWAWLPLVILGTG